jgi:uncharacterized protein (TIGR03000 family)
VTPPPAAPAKPGTPTHTSIGDTQGFPAIVTVNADRGTKLFVDDLAIPLGQSPRSFVTPALQPGRSYYYTLKAEMTRDGQAIVQTRKVFVEAGKEAVVDFLDAKLATTASR